MFQCTIACNFAFSFLFNPAGLSFKHASACARQYTADIFRQFEHFAAMSEMSVRDQNVFMARLAEQAERYEDMVEFMRRVAIVPQELSLDERNLLSVAYKNSVGARRQAWRAIHTYMQKMASASDPAVAEIAMYRRRVEDELNEKCNDIIKILDSDLVPKAVSSEAKVFYLKMRGDYYRYLAEFTDGPQRGEYANAAHESYHTANELAVPLPPTHPIRLGLALNFSVFYYEVYKYTDKACQLAKEAFENAMSDLDSLDAEQYKDSAAIMQLLRDNLALWQNDLPGARPAKS
eukprot:Skav211585  [mRNA]  locus=scaffold393:7723:13231:+ [translate_table: standard]